MEFAQIGRGAAVREFARQAAVFSVGYSGHHWASNLSSEGGTMISVVEWNAPARNAAWVAACFGSLGA